MILTKFQDLKFVLFEILLFFMKFQWMILNFLKNDDWNYN
jgi:hypothetical protein